MCLRRGSLNASVLQRDLRSGGYRGFQVSEFWVWGLMLLCGTLLDPQACGAWHGAREGPVLGLWRCEMHVGWGRSTREGIESVEVEIGSWRCQKAETRLEVKAPRYWGIPAKPSESSESGDMI